MELLTPGGLAGVAVVRVDADERAALLPLLHDRRGGPFTLQAGGLQRALLRLDGGDLDDVLVVDRGRGGLELHVHGAPAVLDALRGRFPMRAAAATSPAMRLLWEAMGETQLDLALEQLAFDFHAALAALARLPEPERSAARHAALERSRPALAMATPQRVVLIGQQNAGKSSLFNRLLCRERVLTGPTAGLTRDPVAERTVLAGYPYELIDTAGEGPASAPVDAEAIERGRAQRRDAIVVLLVDAGLGPTAADRALLADSDLVIASKSDRPRAPWPATMPCHAEVSALAGDLAALRTAFGERLRRHRGLPPAGPVGGFAALSVAQLEALRALAP